MKRDTVMDAIDFARNILIVILAITAMNILSTDITNTWHDTRIICQHVTHSQKECR